MPYAITTSKGCYPRIQIAKIAGIDGSAITADALASGNRAGVTGEGTMLESWPGQYPGISR